MSELSKVEQRNQAEIERMKEANRDLQRECMKRGTTIADMQRLITRAADALDGYVGPQGPDNQVDLYGMQLVDELREATE